jgi:hypothetical protein
MQGVIRLTSEAEAQVDRLIAHYEAKGRIAASVNSLKTPPLISGVFYVTSDIPNCV